MTDNDERSQRLFKDYLKRKASGEAVTPEEYICRHPELEGALKSLFKELKAGEPVENALPDAVLSDFRIIREIGSGGMGTVYEAEQISLKRRVALKVLPAHLSFSDDAVQKFRREAEAGGRQNHPGIVTIHGVGEDKGTHFIAQELVESGDTLADRLIELKQERPRPTGYFREAAQLAAEVADALEHAHEAGVIHRDVKPSNILLTSEGKPKVTDFGLARVEDALALSRTGEFMGTPYYMSPEQAASRRIGIDRRTDIFSLGVTLYEMLALERPFQGKTTQEVLKKILLHEAMDPRRISPRVPRDLAVICLKAMEKRPEARYATMGEMADDLRRYLAGEVILARPPGFCSRVMKRVKRNPAISTTLTIALLAVLVLVLYVLWSYPRVIKERSIAAMEAERARNATEEAMEERDAKIRALDDLEKVLERSEGLRLAALSKSLSDSKPGAALRLALESSRRRPGLEANNAIMDALQTCHERNILFAFFDDPPEALSFSKDGSRVLICGSVNLAFLWDVKTGERIVEFRGHEKDVVTAVFSPDFKRVLTASDDHTARIWDAATGEQLLVLEGHGHILKSAAFSPDGGRVLTFALDKTVRIWDATSGAEILKLNVSVSASRFSPDSQRVATIEKGRNIVKVRDAGTGNVLLTHKVITPVVHSVEYDAEGKELLLGTAKNCAYTLDAESGDISMVFVGHEGPVERARFSGDGRHVITASDDGTARIWDRASGAELAVLDGHEDRVKDAVLPDDRRAFTFSDLDKTIRIWDSATGKQLGVLKGHEGNVTSMAVSPDGRHIVSTGRDQSVRYWSAKPFFTPIRLGSKEEKIHSAHIHERTGNLVIVWDRGDAEIATADAGDTLFRVIGKEIELAADGDSTVSFEDSSSTKVTWTDQKVRISKSKHIVNTREGVKSAVLSLDGGRLLTITHKGRMAQVLDTESGEVLSTVKAFSTWSLINSGGFSPDGSRVVLALSDRQAWIFEAETGTITAKLMGHEQVLINIFNFFNATFSPDGTRVLTSSGDGTARVWDADTGKELMKIDDHKDFLTYARFSPDGRWIATNAFQMMMRVYDTRTGEEVFSSWNSNSASPFSMDSRFIAAGSPYSRAVDVVEVGANETRATLWGHTDMVLNCIFSPDGRQLATTSDDGTVRIWEIESAEEVLTFNGHSSSVTHAEFSTDGKQVLSLDADGIAMIWPVDPLSLLERNPPRELTLRERLMYDVWAEGEEKSSHLIDRLFKDFSSLQELVHEMSKDPNLSEEVRKAALIMANDLTELSEQE